MSKANVLDAIERLNFALSKVDDFEDIDVDLSQRVLENRIITLEGYLRYLESVGMPKIKKIQELLEDDYNDRSDLL